MNNIRTQIIGELDRFKEHKENLYYKLVVAISELSEKECLAKWELGEKEHGVINEDSLKELDIDKAFKEEVIDAFWYSVMQELKSTTP
ncbi:MAG: hypothetical protein HOG49_39670 [Candidatus Scalindua sp.]|jgi:hypothetical protein|nr:hypothetical protein [Candidatus Scalindua sp.]